MSEPEPTRSARPRTEILNGWTQVEGDFLAVYRVTKTLRPLVPGKAGRPRKWLPKDVSDVRRRWAEGQTWPLIRSATGIPLKTIGAMLDRNGQYKEVGEWFEPLTPRRSRKSQERPSAGPGAPAPTDAPAPPEAPTSSPRGPGAPPGPRPDPPNEAPPPRTETPV